MRHSRIALIALLSLSCACFAHPSYVRADAACYQNAVPTPLPTTGAATLPVCIGGVLQTTGGGGGPAANVTIVSPIPLPVTGPSTATAGFPAPNPVTIQGILMGQGLIVQIGGSLYDILTSASPQTCTSVEVNSTSGMLAEIINSGSPQTVFLQVYDEGAAPTCSAADNFYGDGTTLTLAAGQIVTFGFPLKHGLAYKITGGALGANVTFTYN